MDSKKMDQNKSSKEIIPVKGNDLSKTNMIRNSLSKTKKEMTNSKLKDGDDTKGLSIFQKAKQLTSMITVEPILACYVMPSVLSALATQNLYLEKACRVNLKFEDHVCDALTRRETANFTFEEEAVQTLVASIAGWKTVLQSFLPCILLLFFGAYSDRIGQRKFCMLLPIIGEFLTSIGLILNTYFFYQLPIEIAAVTEAIFPALTGGWVVMFMGIFSYIGDVTTEEQRTLRIGIVNLFYSLGVPVGAALSGILVKTIGLYGVFSLSATLYVFSFMYGFFRIKETKKPDSNMKPTTNCCGWLRSFFDTRYVKDTVMVAFKKGPNRRRLRVIMLVVVLCVVIGPIYGELAVLYLFTRFRFNWNEVDYSMFSTYSVCINLLGTLFSVSVFSHLLQFDDAIIGVISCTSKILAAFMYAFATKTWHLYIAPLIEIFNGTSFIAMRSMISKLVAKDELGKVNSFVGLAEAMMPLVYAPMYTSVYSATIKSFPGAFFLLGGALTFPAVLIFLWLYLANKKYQNTKTIIAAEDRTDNEKLGIDNKSYLPDENNKIGEKNHHSNEAMNDSEKSAQQAQIEMGITEGVLCNSKL